MKIVLKLKKIVVTIGAIALFTLCLTPPAMAANAQDISQIEKDNWCVSFLWKQCDLSGADLSGANLELCDFRGAEVGYANFSDANLVGANFEGCFMARINLSRANLSNAELMRAVLAGGNLVEANFCGADLTGATLLGAKLEGTVFDGAILQDVRWGEFAKEDSSSDTLESTSLEDIQISTTDTDCESPDIKRE